MKIYTIIEQNDKYLKLSSENEITIIPIVDVILVDDNSGYISIKNTASRKTIGLIKKSVEPVPPTPPTPTPITDLICKYNVTSTTSETALTYSTLNFDAMYVDGSYKKFARTYKFDTLGEHTVKFLLEDDTKIQNGSFRRLSALTSVTIPDSVTEIGSQSFSECTGLTSVTIGNGVTMFSGIRTFYNCTSLTSVTINATTPPRIGTSGVFDNTNANLVIYVPAQSVEEYKTNWSTYADRIQAIQ